MTLLALEEVSSGYGGVATVKGVSLAVGRGEIVALIGANGAGKTTLLRTIAGLLPASAGRILLDGVDIHRDAPQLIARRGISLVPQNRGLFPYMSVADNLKLGCFLLRGTRAIADRMEQVLGWFPILRERARQRAHTLSGGEQQMLAIARGLMRQPAIMMLDEPSLALAPKVVGEIARIVEELCRSGTTILLVEQNVRMALSVAHRAYVLSMGSIVIQAPAAELLADERIQQIYLGSGAPPAHEIDAAE